MVLYAPTIDDSLSSKGDAPILNETSTNAASASPDTSSTVVLSSAVHLLDRLPSLGLQFKYSSFIQPNIDIEGNSLGYWLISICVFSFCPPSCANSVAYSQDSPPNSVVQEVIPVDGVEKLLVREKEHLVLL
ncbi:unnamed protein product [Lactuca saligna]|uniref:Uncharacterized protein n=1 Tax=Lactuca saligna TaxID=75948 RepID=A0AA35VYM3_LACSI|nr:unnamed protein product [Lactuca saligna]